MQHSMIPLVAVFVLLANPASGQSSAVSAPAGSSLSPVTPAATVPGFQERNARYRLRKGDSVDLDFEFSPEF